MKKYTDPENQRYVYYIRETLNGFAVQVLNVQRDERYPLSPTIAGHLGLNIPEGMSFHSCTKETAEASLESLARLNDFILVD